MGISACESVLDPKDFNTSPKMVVHCFFSPGQPWEVELSVSRNVLNDTLQPIWLQQADISISGDDGSYIDDFEFKGKGKYINSEHRPVEGVLYTISIVHDDYPRVTASDSAPKTMDIGISLKQAELNGKTWIEMTADPVQPAMLNHLIISNQVRKTYLNEKGDTLVFDEQALMMPGPSSSGDFLYIEGENQVQTKLYLKKLSTNSFSLLSQGGYRKASDINLIDALSAWLFYFGSETFFGYQWITDNSKTYLESDGTTVYLKSDYYSNINNGYGIFAGFNLIRYEKTF